MSKKIYHLYAILTVALWSLAYVFTRLALAHFSPFSIGFLRYAIASVILAAVLLIKKAKMPSKKDLPWLFLSGASGFFLYMLAFNTGSKTITSATGSTVLATVPVITALLAQAVYKEKLKPVQYIGIAVSFAGVVLLTMLKGELSANTGLLIMLAAAVFMSTYNVLQRKLTKTCPPLQTTAFSIFFGTLLLAVFAPAAFRELSTAPAEQWAYIMVLGVFSSAVAYCLWTKAMSVAKNTSSVSNYVFLSPFFSAVFGLIIAGESVDTPTVLGGAVILTGIAIFNFWPQIKKILGK